MAKFLDSIVPYADRFVNYVYSLHMNRVFTEANPILLWLFGIVLFLLLYHWLGSAVSLNRLRRVTKAEKEKSDRMSRELAREKRARVDVAEKCKVSLKSNDELNDKVRTLTMEYESMMSFIPGQAWFFDSNAKFIKASQLELGDLHAGVGNCEGKSLLDMFGDFANELQNVVVKSVNTRQPILGHEIEAPYNGQVKYYTFDMHPVLNDDRMFSCLLVIVRDTSEITEVKTRSDQMLRRVGDGVLVVQNDIIRYANPRLELLVGAGRGELAEKPFETVFDEAATKPWKPSENDDVWNPLNLRLFSTQLKGGKGEGARIVYTLGHTVWNGAEADLLFVRDQHACARVEKEKLQSEQVMNTLLDTIDQGVVIIDPEEHILQYNMKLLEMWELSEAIFTVRRWDAVFNSMKTKVTDPAAYEQWLRGEEHSKQETVVCELTLKNGRTLICAARQFGEQESIGRIVAYLDITSTRKREAELKKALEGAEDATQTKSEFLARMSHEIRTPMNGIIGVATLMERTNLDHRQQRYMDVVKVSADSLLNLINDILDFSKIEAGYLKLEKIDFDLVETIGAAADLLALKAQSKGLELLTFLRPDVPTYFRGDPNRLRQIIINLGNNAIKFTDKGQVVIHCEVDKASDRDYTLHFRITDTGVGIKPDKLDAIFESYEQEDVSTARQFGGTGLGLSICKHLVELMHGKIWVESVYGEGASFHFTIRLRPRADENLEQEIETFQSREPRVLVAVRNDITQRFIAETLTFYGVSCAVIESPELIVDALKTAAGSNQGFDLLLMETFDGMYEDIARSLTSERELMDVHCILLASFAESSTMVVPEDVFVSEMMNLPLKRAELMQTMKRVLGLATDDDQQTGQIMQAGDSLRILLAEDNPINQGIVTEILESEGHAVAPANNGEEVLKLLSEHDFDVVFMDVHMPVMDGLETTLTIRAREEEDQHQRIVAMTADVLSDDRDKCLDVGMDDFITKPLKLDDLRKVLHRVMAMEPGETPAPVAVESAAAASDDISIDMKHVKDTLGDNTKIISKTFDLILRKFPQSNDAIGKALKEEDSAAVHRAAHGMKGFLNYFDVPDLLELVVDLEKAGKNGDLKRAKQIHIDLGPMITVFLKALEQARSQLQ